MGRHQEVAVLTATAHASARAAGDRDAMTINAAGIAGLLIDATGSVEAAVEASKRLPDETIFVRAREYLRRLERRPMRAVAT